MDKLDLHTIARSMDNYRKLAELFPGALSETITGYDKNGNPIIERALDVNAIRQEIAVQLLEGPEERYQFTWPNKQKARLSANMSVNKTLRPCREESVNFDTTENLYIEGDNLDILRLIRKTYASKIKMIYIDPPYNTGFDRLYKDDFSQGSDGYMSSSGQFDERGNQMVLNPESNGRFHTDWLNMMYPRLLLARDLLRDDGVIFISIDDHEVDNLKKICTEIFGEENFVAKIPWQSRASIQNDTDFSINHEYICVYAKYRLQETQQIKALNDQCHQKGGFVCRSLPPTIDPLNDPEKLKNHRIVCPNNDLEKPQLKVFEKNVWGVVDNSWFSAGYVGTSTNGTKELMRLFGGSSYFSTPKPTSLIRKLIDLSNVDSGDIVLDFFSGSATTAHAVMQLNAKDGGRRKFIMIQCPEKTGVSSEARRAGYENICEIAKERLRRAGAQIKADNPLVAQTLDVGFRVLKCDTSNIKDAYSPKGKTNQNQLDFLADNVKADRSPEDLLFQVMLRLEIPLSSPVEITEVAGKNLFDVGHNFLLTCLDANITRKIVIEAAKRKPCLFVMRDRPIAAGDFEQIFQHYSPDTELRVL